MLAHPVSCIKSANERTKVLEHFERANARPEGWSTGCAE